MKFYYFTVILVGIIIVFNLAGVVTPAGGGLAKALNLIDDNQNLTVQDVKNSELWSNENSTDIIPGIKFLLLGAVAAGIVLGVFGRSPDIRYITAAIVFAISAFLLTDIIYIFTIIASYDSWIKFGIGAIIGGLTAGFIITVLEFWQGTD